MKLAAVAAVIDLLAYRDSCMDQTPVESSNFCAQREYRTTKVL